VSNTSDLPQGWTRAEIAEISLAGETWNPRTAAVDQFKYVDIEAVDNKRQRIVSPRTLPTGQAPGCARVAIKKGDVLFSLVRPYLKNIAVVPEKLDGQVASTAFLAFRPANGVNSSFVFNYFLQDSFINSVPTYGNSPPAARDEEFVRLRVPLAPSEEQKRISGKE
jgi:type I restriction enzyme S subunit